MATQMSVRILRCVAGDGDV